MDFLRAGAISELIQHHLLDHLDLRILDPGYAVLVEADVRSDHGCRRVSAELLSIDSLH